MTTQARYLIVNADDFGRSRGINSGVALAHRRGIVTSASLMVRWPAAAEAAIYARAHHGLGVGLHFDLSEWSYGERGWTASYRVVRDESPAAIAAEIERQLDTFHSLMGSAPTHLDSHQHVHREEPTRRLLADAGSALGVPVRDCSPGIAYRGDFYGQTGTGKPLPEAISVDWLIHLIASLPAGVTELGCHPAAEPEHASVYATERTQELRVLCDPRVREALRAQGVTLRSFADLTPKLRPGAVTARSAGS